MYLRNQFNAIAFERHSSMVIRHCKINANTERLIRTHACKTENHYELFYLGPPMQWPIDFTENEKYIYSVVPSILHIYNQFDKDG